MNHLFTPNPSISVPDGTEVAEILPHHTPGISLAQGKISPGVNSLIHVHPFVEQITYLVSGSLTIRMQDGAEGTPYDLELKPGDSSLCRIGTAFQLRNPAKTPAEVLYIVMPAFRYAENEYNDSVMLGADWDKTTQAALIETEDPVFRAKMQTQRNALP